MSEPKADAYGGVVMSGGGRVLLREPSLHFGGYVWTFAKGRPDPGETAQQTALREVLEETGYSARILAPIPGVFAGTTGSTVMYLMDASYPPVPAGQETKSLRWVSIAEARELIALTTTVTGVQRDLAILDAAIEVLAALPAGLRPAVQPEDFAEVVGGLQPAS
jgi:8-oxo-dGTP pyrophosphatase MutT (NUDIX family)